MRSVATSRLADLELAELAKVYFISVYIFYGFSIS